MLCPVGTLLAAFVTIGALVVFHLVASNGVVKRKLFILFVCGFWLFIEQLHVFVVVACEVWV